MSYDQLKAAGFSDEELADYKQLSDAGFSEEEIVEHLSTTKPVQKLDAFTGQPVVRGKNIPIPGVSTENTPYLQAQTPYSQAAKEGVRYGIPMAAGVAAGFAPWIGAIAGPVAAAGSDYLLSKAFGEEAGADDLKNRGMNLGIDIAAGLAVPGGKTVMRGGRAVINALKKTPVDEQITSAVRRGLEKGIRPSVSGKQNFHQVKKYYDNAESAVKSIIENKAALKYTDGDVGLPKNLNQFSEAIDQTKRQIFSKYDYMLKSSELAGRGIVLDDIGAELNRFAGDRVRKLAGGSGLKYASDKAGEYYGELTLTEAQDLIAALNQRQKAFLKNPTPDQVSSAAVDAYILNNLRSKVDSAVEKYGYSELKKQYGALREIENEVARRAIVDARKNVKGLMDFSDIYTTAELAHAIATMNPSSGGFALAMRGMKEYYKRLNDPNKIIENMFKDVDRLSSKVKPKEMKALPPGPRVAGSGIKDVSGIKVETGEPFYPTERSIADVTKGAPSEVVDYGANYSPMELGRMGEWVGIFDDGLPMLDGAYYPLDMRGIGYKEPLAIGMGERRIPVRATKDFYEDAFGVNTVPDEYYHIGKKYPRGRK